MAFASSRRARWIAAAIALLAASTIVETRNRSLDLGAGSPQLTIYKYWDWGWGELLYGQSYTTTLKVINACPTDQGVTFTVTDPFFEVDSKNDAGQPITIRWWVDPPTVQGAPQNRVPDDHKPIASARAMMSIPQPGCNAVPFGTRGSREPTTCSATVKPGPTDFEVTIVTPAPPDPKTIPKGADPLMIYDVIAGKLVVHTDGNPDACLPNREEYIPNGHVHLDPNAGGGGPRCRDWWDREQKPRGLTRDCTKEIRDLALEYLRVTLKPRVEKDRKAWAWLPTEEQILTMSIEELIAMKVRARATVTGRR